MNFPWRGLEGAKERTLLEKAERKQVEAGERELEEFSSLIMMFVDDPEEARRLAEFILRDKEVNDDPEEKKRIKDLLSRGKDLLSRGKDPEEAKKFISILRESLRQEQEQLQEQKPEQAGPSQGGGKGSGKIPVGVVKTKKEKPEGLTVTTAGIPGDGLDIPIMEPKKTPEEPEKTPASPEAEKFEELEARLRQLEEENRELRKILEQLGVENKELQEENEKLREKLEKGQIEGGMSLEMLAFVHFWADYFVNQWRVYNQYSYYGYGGFYNPGAVMMWSLPWLIRGEMERVYGVVDYTLVDAVYRTAISRIMVPVQPFPGGMFFPPLPPQFVGNLASPGAIAAGRDVVNIFAGGIPPAPPRTIPVKGESGAQAPAETQAKPEEGTSPEEEKEEEIEPEPKDPAIKSALDELLGKYALEKGKRGRFRGAILPLVGIIEGAAKVSSAALLSPAAVIGPTFVMAGSVGIGSIIASLFGRWLGQNALTFWSRYSHVEGRGIVKALRYWGRGAERGVMKRILDLEGNSKELQELEQWFDKEVPQAVMDDFKNNPEKLKNYLASGLWYVVAINVILSSGAYLHENEKKEWTARAMKVSEVINRILEGLGYKAGEKNTDELLKEVVKKVEEREKESYWKQAGMVALIGAGKAAIGVPVAAGLYNFIKGAMPEVVSAISNFFHRFTAPISGAPTGAGGVENLAQAAGATIEGSSHVISGVSFGHFFQQVTGMSADYIWNFLHGREILGLFVEANKNNPELWRYLQGLIDNGLLLKVEDGVKHSAHLAEVLGKLGVGPNDFSPDLSRLAELSHDDLLELFRYVGFPGWAQKILGQQLHLVVPNKAALTRVISR